MRAGCGGPGEAVGAVGVAGEVVEFLAVGGGEQGDGAGGAGGGEEKILTGWKARATPGEVDGVVVELGGPVFGELHGRRSEE